MPTPETRPTRITDSATLKPRCVCVCVECFSLQLLSSYFSWYEKGCQNHIGIDTNFRAVNLGNKSFRLTEEWPFCSNADFASLAFLLLVGSSSSLS